MPKSVMDLFSWFTNFAAPLARIERTFDLSTRK